MRLATSCPLIAVAFAVVLTSVLAVPGSAFAQDDDQPKPDIAQADTSYEGARVLKYGMELFGAQVAPGLYADGGKEAEDVYRYATWQGDTLFFGAENPETGNTVDGVAEFYWFESSVPKSADFYVVVLKVKSAPSTTDGWSLSQEDGGWFAGWVYDMHPCQMVQVDMGQTGDSGAVRWDWCVPFQNYPMEPLQTIQIEQSYSAGYDLAAKGDAGVDGKVPFAEGSFLKDLTLGATIQGKGYYNKKFSVSSNYTITLYKWEMLVQGGAKSMKWNLVVTKDGSAANSSAYHEYYVVVQAPQGAVAKVDEIRIAANFRDEVSFWFDKEESLSVTVKDITFTPPIDIECYGSDDPPSDLACIDGVGQCKDLKPVCVDGKWECKFPPTYEPTEVTCDGLDNDCDGLVDHELVETCSGACGNGVKFCTSGVWSECSAEPIAEICNGVDDDCDGKTDEDLTQLCTSQCGNAVRKCEGGEWGECQGGEPGTEVCDGVDNDCDGDVDEGVVKSCENDCGGGIQTCQGGKFGPCATDGLEEICDAKDNDCNGLTDEALFQPCATACGQGQESCTNGIWYGCTAKLPTLDACGDGLDQDCDGQIDNGPDCGTSNPGDPKDPGDDEEPDDPEDPDLEDPTPVGPGTPGAGSETTGQAPLVVNTGGGCSGAAGGSAPLGLAFALLALALVSRRRTA